MIDDLVRRSHLVLIVITLILTAYCTTIMFLNKPQRKGQKPHDLVVSLSYSVYILVCIYRFIIVSAFVRLYQKLIE